MNLDEIPDPSDRYEIGDILGFGVYGKVYSATDNQASKKKVAIKLQKYEEGVKEFIEEEYKILRDFSSQANLIDFYGIYRKDYEIWFVLELCEGGPVIDLVQGLLLRNRRMTEEHIAYILKETVKALIYLHENDIIHRDVKGSNILLTREGEVKLCDFGLSRKLKCKEQRLSARLGSPSWMAPELASANLKKKNAKYDNRVDVWSTGITAIELAEGKVPFQDMHPTRAIFQIVTNPPPQLLKISYWSENFHDFISECLAKYYDYRPYMMEIIDHPFLNLIPDNNYHLSLEIKSLLSDIGKMDPSKRNAEINVNGRFLKKSVDGNMEPMYEEDLAALHSISERDILALLEKRVEMGEHYFFIGDILMYLNPNQDQNIYKDEFHRKYCFKSRSENAPHIYAIGDTAYQNALHHGIPQQIVLSGETGSGKTSNYLHLLDHLFYLGENPSVNSVRIGNAVKLIHSLIHASTPANDYSTRAVFKTVVFYGKTGKLSGACFKVHCLEKWRVSETDMAQSNFHFIYYIYDGLMSTGRTEEFKLNSNREYRYLRIGEELKTGQPKDNIDQNFIKYRKLKTYLCDMEFSDEQLNTIISVVAAILNLGETRFRENDGGFAEIENKAAVERFSELMKVEDQKISWALTNYCLVYEGRAIRKQNTCEEARDTRDVLANNLYVRMVDYIVGIINDKLSMGRAIFGEAYSIKILDYFGFECFKQNNLSQFMVNCLNEQLHYHFLQRVFSWEAHDSQNQELEFIPIDYYNNKDTLNELLGKPEGVLSIIDDASKSGLNGRYVIGNINNQGKSKIILTDALEFSVAHYTGRVSYNAREMPRKNRDFLPPEIIETMRNSHDPIISMFFTNKLDKTGNLIIPSEDVKKSKCFTPKESVKQFSQIRKMRTQIAIFRALSLNLLKELSVGSGSGGTHFVRCLRTDLQRRPQYFQKELIRQQIRALAIVETVKARKQGYPHRISFSEFLRRYKFLAFDFDENVEPTNEYCRLLMIRLKMEGWALGKTEIFLKYYNEEYLSRLYETQVKKIIKIQSILRGFITKCRMNKKIKDQEKECSTADNAKANNTEGDSLVVLIVTTIFILRMELLVSQSQTSRLLANLNSPLHVIKQLTHRPLHQFNSILNMNKVVKEIKNRRKSSIMTEDEAAGIIQKAYRKSAQRKEISSEVYESLKEKDLHFIKPFAAKWKNKSIFYILMRYRAIKLQEFFNFSQQVHFYNLNAFHITQQCKEGINLNVIDKKARVCTWIGDNVKSVLKLKFHLDEIPFYDTSHMHDLLTNSGSYEREDCWDMPYRWRESYFLQNTQDIPVKKNVEDNIVNIEYIRDPNKPIRSLLTPVEEAGENNNAMGVCDDTEIYRDTESPEASEARSDDECSGKIDSNSINLDSRREASATNGKSRKYITEPKKYTTNTTLANNDFDYIKATPAPRKNRPNIDPIAELKSIARKDSASDDDPPFNFQAMLRKTNFRRDSMNRNSVLDSPKKGSARKDSLKDLIADARRDSLKNAFEAVRRYSLTKDQEKREHIMTNGHYIDEPIICKQISLEILPGLVIDGLEVEL